MQSVCISPAKAPIQPAVVWSLLNIMKEKPRPPPPTVLMMIMMMMNMIMSSNRFCCENPSLSFSGICVRAYVRAYVAVCVCVRVRVCVPLCV